ncbi:helix-turn-helix domain-containing protein [Streptomyces tibetensis]|uniref:helix-turn-helix domain-containing protein n=1 Tax=Streptomyces tibetensis TaxID=2382123 RepID=UPI0033E0CFEA
MGKNGHVDRAEITDVPYRPLLSAPLGMDVLDFAELRDRGRRRGIDLTAPQRPAFHHLIHVHGGSGPLRHTVDFSDHTLRPGSWLRIRPGQVHQYSPDELAPARGTIVIWQPGFTATDPEPGPAPPGDPSPLLPGPAHDGALALALRHLTHEYADLGAIPLDAHIEALRHLLGVLLLRLTHARSGRPLESASADGAFGRYHAAVERDFGRTHRVADYASALGYSVRTLTRATLAATGSTAKQYLDARILLEAKRLLVHTDATSADIAGRLGFRDPGDFAKFFRKRDGRAPQEFRSAARGTQPAD